MQNKFHYHNTEKHIHGKKHITRKVIIKNGKGHKSITTMKKGGKRYTTKRRLNIVEMINIKNRKFMRGLFSDFPKNS